MKVEITPELIERMGSRSLTLLELELSREPEECRGGRALEASVVLNSIVWEIVIPILVGVLSGVTVEAVKRAIKSGRRAKGSRQESVEPELRESILLVTEERRAECVTRVRRELGPYGIQDEQVERLVREVIRETRIWKST